MNMCNMDMCSMISRMDMHVAMCTDMCMDMCMDFVAMMCHEHSVTRAACAYGVAQHVVYRYTHGHGV